MNIFLDPSSSARKATSVMLRVPLGLTSAKFSCAVLDGLPVSASAMHHLPHNWEHDDECDVTLVQIPCDSPQFDIQARKPIMYAAMLAKKRENPSGMES
ncbi:hypothetical protein DMENIID0001_112940 [Sergentomyia squamirostris]